MNIQLSHLEVRVYGGDEAADGRAHPALFCQRRNRERLLVDEPLKHGKVVVEAASRVHTELVRLHLGSQLLMVAYEDEVLHLWSQARQHVRLQHLSCFFHYHHLRVVPQALS